MKKNYTRIRGVLDEALEGYTKKDAPSPIRGNVSGMAHTCSNIYSSPPVSSSRWQREGGLLRPPSP
jgi:hypothetical protein